MKTERIYVDIASLLDVRHGALFTLVEDKDKLAQYIGGESYNLRTLDDFSEVCDMSLLNSKLSAGEVAHLKHSPMTYIAQVIRSRLTHHDKRVASTGEPSQCVVMVNVYPYRITESASDVLRNTLFTYMGARHDVEIVYFEPREITMPKLTQLAVYVAFIYDVARWMQCNAQYFSNQQWREIAVHLPATGKEALDETQMRELRATGFKDIFAYTEYLMSSSLRVEFLPICMYSASAISELVLSQVTDVLKKEPLPSSMTPEEIEAHLDNVLKDKESSDDSER